MDYTRIESIVSPVDKFLPQKGTQIGFHDKRYAIGELCRLAELEWDRPLNSTPSTDHWKALFFAAILNHSVSDCSVVVGAPHSLVEVFSSEIKEGLTGKHELFLPDNTVRVVTINKAVVMSECAGHALAFTKELGVHSLVISIGFGTVELGAATEEGIIEKSLASINFGLHQAVPFFRNELRALGYDNPMIRDDQFFYWDKIIQRVVDRDENLLLNYNGKVWEAVDLALAAENALKKYAESLVKHIANYFKKFDTKMPVVVTGGGVRYSAVASKMEEFLKSIKYTCSIANEETSLISAAVGYKYVAKELFGAKGVGIDIGNHSVVTIK
jgi:hypothetical protein